MKIISFFKRKLRNRMNVWLATDEMVRIIHPPGHFYSPLCNPKEIEAMGSQLWNDQTHQTGIDMNKPSHDHILNEVFPRYIEQFEYVEHQHETTSDNEFYIQNSQYSWLDARLLFVLLNAWKPKKVIEVGSGFSSLLIADVNHRFLNDSIELTCIEPYPRAFLKNKIAGLDRVIEKKVQQVPFALFETLEAGDLLFIDSSHVAKTGSDVNHLFLQVLPQLKKGVIIHIHDVFLPFEYPKLWAIEENRSWNEQYLLQALLINSRTFKVVFGSTYAHHCYPDKIAAILNKPLNKSFGGVSFYLEKID